jgi:hypothetical protein
MAFHDAWVEFLRHAYAGYRDVTFELTGSVQLMKVLQSDEPDVGIDKSGSRSHPVLKDLRGRSLTIGWAATVLVAMAGWLYFVARASWFFVDWLLR